jgi:hypothetical protein
MIKMMPIRDVINPEKADAEAYEFRSLIRECGWVGVNSCHDSIGAGILTDGSRATTTYTKFKTATTQPQARAAIVGRISRLSGQRARPAVAHCAVVL